MPLENTIPVNHYPPMMPPPPRDCFQTRPHPLRTYSFESISSYSDMDDSNQELCSQKRSHRSQRRLPPNPEYVKHRRTRSGCYTCRQRRVKCDEAHPVCERCRKGKRHCTYPDSTPVSKQARTTVKSKSLSLDSASSPSDDEADGNAKEFLPFVPVTDDGPILDETETKSATTEHSFRDESVLDNDSVMSPSTDSAETPIRMFRTTAISAYPAHSNALVAQGTYSGARSVALPEDVKALLVYRKEKMCHHHYAFRSDLNDFSKTTLVDIAINDENEALLYAVVAFAAYHRTFALEDCGIYNFLSYYNKSIVLLQQLLNRERPNTTTLLAILQLATIEEFLGDWVTLIGHQKACHQIIIDLFTPQSILQNETRRQILRWYIRFEILAGAMSDGEVNLGREWLAAYREYYTQETKDRPYDLGAKFEQYFSTNRLLGADFTMLFKARAKAQIPEDQYISKCSQLIDQLGALGHDLRLAFSSSNFANSISRIHLSDETDSADYPEPNIFYDGDLFTLNLIMLDVWTVELMIRQQLSPPNSSDLATIAFKMYNMIETMHYRDQARTGALIPCQAGIGTASLFLPQKPKYIDWARHKFAAIEDMGYICPAAIRERMSHLWGLDVRQSWVPNNENNPLVLRNVREFIGYRERVPAAALDVQLRKMSGIFSSLYSDQRGTKGS